MASNFTWPDFYRRIGMSDPDLRDMALLDLHTAIRASPAILDNTNAGLVVDILLGQGTAAKASGFGSIADRNADCREKALGLCVEFIRAGSTATGDATNQQAAQRRAQQLVEQLVIASNGHKSNPDFAAIAIESLRSVVDNIDRSVFLDLRRLFTELVKKGLTPETESLHRVNVLGVLENIFGKFGAYVEKQVKEDLTNICKTYIADSSSETSLIKACARTMSNVARFTTEEFFAETFEFTRQLLIKSTSSSALFVAAKLCEQAGHRLSIANIDELVDLLTAQLRSLAQQDEPGSAEANQDRLNVLLACKGLVERASEHISQGTLLKIVTIVKDLIRWDPNYDYYDDEDEEEDDDDGGDDFDDEDDDYSCALRGTAADTLSVIVEHHRDKLRLVYDQLVTCAPEQSLVFCFRERDSKAQHRILEAFLEILKATKVLTVSDALELSGSKALYGHTEDDMNLDVQTQNSEEATSLPVPSIIDKLSKLLMSRKTKDKQKITALSILQELINMLPEAAAGNVPLLVKAAKKQGGHTRAVFLQQSLCKFLFVLTFLPSFSANKNDAVQDVLTTMEYALKNLNGTQATPAAVVALGEYAKLLAVSGNRDNAKTSMVNNINKLISLGEDRMTDNRVRQEVLLALGKVIREGRHITSEADFARTLEYLLKTLKENESARYEAILALCMCRHTDIPVPTLRKVYDGLASFVRQTNVKVRKASSSTLIKYLSTSNAKDGVDAGTATALVAHILPLLNPAEPGHTTSALSILNQITLTGTAGAGAVVAQWARVEDTILASSAHWQSGISDASVDLMSSIARSGSHGTFTRDTIARLSAKGKDVMNAKTAAALLGALAAQGGDVTNTIIAEIQGSLRTHQEFALNALAVAGGVVPDDYNLGPVVQQVEALVGAGIAVEAQSAAAVAIGRLVAAQPDPAGPTSILAQCSSDTLGHVYIKALQEYIRVIIRRDALLCVPETVISTLLTLAASEKVANDEVFRISVASALSLLPTQTQDSSLKAVFRTLVQASTESHSSFVKGIAALSLRQIAQTPLGKDFATELAQVLPRLVTENLTTTSTAENIRGDIFLRSACVEVLSLLAQHNPGVITLLGRDGLRDVLDRIVTQTRCYDKDAETLNYGAFKSRRDHGSRLRINVYNALGSLIDAMPNKNSLLSVYPNVSGLIHEVARGLAVEEDGEVFAQAVCPLAIKIATGETVSVALKSHLAHNLPLIVRGEVAAAGGSAAAAPATAAQSNGLVARLQREKPDPAKVTSEDLTAYDEHRDAVLRVVEAFEKLPGAAEYQEYTDLEQESKKPPKQAASKK